ncbi:hypothetical protein MMC11_008376 [Xylographa trunciseda]|nr:hypothetical protein [Xylographa trunciseda]
MSLSINVWTFGALSGVDYYRIDPAIGTSHSLMCLIIASSLIQLPLSAVKISILLFYKRIFSTPRFKTAVWVMIALVSVWGIIFFVLLLIQGDPISATWTGIGILRFDSTALGLAQVGSSIILDIIVLCLPVPVIFGLHMRTQRKVAIAMIFWLGAFCCVAAIVRLVLINQSVRAVIDSQSSGFTAICERIPPYMLRRNKALTPADLQSKQFIFLILEPNCSIIAACLPCYGPLLAKGRSPESLVRSVRSVFSLRSRTSSVNHSQTKFTEVAPRIGSSLDSQIELKQAAKDWSAAQDQGHGTTTNAESGRDEDNEGYSNSGINVTMAYNVARV